MVVRLSALRTGRFLPTGNTPGTHLCWRLSRSAGLCQLKIPLTPSGIEPATFRLTTVLLRSPGYNQLWYISPSTFTAMKIVMFPLPCPLVARRTAVLLYPRALFLLGSKPYIVTSGFDNCLGEMLIVTYLNIFRYS